MRKIGVTHEEFKIIKLFKHIKEEFCREKYKKVISLCTKFLNEHEDDSEVRYFRADSYRYTEQFKEAILDFEYIIIKEDNSDKKTKALSELYYMLYYLNKYEDAIKLVPLIRKYKAMDEQTVSIMEYIMQVQLGIPTQCKNPKDNYLTKIQINNYSEKLALDHIRCHQDINRQKENITYFNDDIDLEYLFNIIRDNIGNSKKVNTNNHLAVYYYSFPDIGRDFYETYNFLKVLAIPNTDMIISMYPINNINIKYVTEIEYDYGKLHKNKKVKIKSMVDKFNERYKIEE